MGYRAHREKGILVEIVSLLIASLALVAALWSANEARRLRNLERDRDVRRQKEAEQEQAVEVHAHLAVDEPEGGEKKRWYLVVGNASREAVHDVRVETSIKGGAPVLSVQTLAPGTHCFELEWGPPMRFDMGRPVGRLAAPLIALTRRGSMRVEGLTFSDAHGRRWKKDQNGALSAYS